MIEITSGHIETQKVIDSVITEDAGGIDVFIGTVRNHTKGKAVVSLEFEAYEPMARKELQKIVDKASERWPLIKMAVSHVVGERKPGEVVVVIAVSAAHRDAAFEACRYTIDTLKQTVPIWKKEHFTDGSVWVAAHP